MSQQIMLGKTREQAIRDYPFKLAMTYYGQLERVNEWIENQPNIDVLHVNYADAHNFPAETAQKVVDFLGLEVSVKSIVSAIDSSLYRNQTN